MRGGDRSMWGGIISWLIERVHQAKTDMLKKRHLSVIKEMMFIFYWPQRCCSDSSCLLLYDFKSLRPQTLIHSSRTVCNILRPDKYNNTHWPTCLLVNDFTLDFIIYNNNWLQRFGLLAQILNLIMVAHYMPSNPRASFPPSDMHQMPQCTTK